MRMTIGWWGILFGLVTMPSGAATDAAPPAAGPFVVIHAGELLAEPGKPPLRHQTVVVSGQRIVAVHAGLLDAAAAGVPAGAAVEVVDLADRFVLPGLMDAHSHLMWSGGDHPPKKADKMTSEDLTLWTLRNARTTLGAGFTTVREQASGPLPMFAVRDWINAGKFIGPRILAAGNPITAPGGHGDMSQTDPKPGDTAASALCNGPESCRRAVRMQKKLGSNVIKMMATGGFHDATGTEQTFFFEEMQATVEAAHQLGMPVGTHAYAGNAIADAVRAGVDSVDHGFGADDATLKLMKAKGIYLVPTFSIAERPGPARDYREKYRAFERALAIGVPIAFGTDVGGIPHRFAAKEFSYMVRAGMAPEQAIVAATVNTARLFRIADEVGTLTPGRLADIIAVKGSPLQDIAVLEQVDFVMKSGRIAKRDGRLLDIVLD
ncbi:MAG: amidohydrolase family protein [Gammaproteobacteria bacterium]|nr:amidohydrolase family protein [Gammaproteobacteria bacterium]